MGRDRLWDVLALTIADLWRAEPPTRIIATRMHALGRDCCYALARLRRSPGLVCAVVLSLGLGIGATAALFSVVDAIDFRLLPYHDATHVVMLREIPPAPAASCRDCGTSFSTYLDWRRETRSYSAIAAQRMYVRRWWHDDPGGAEPSSSPLPMSGRSFSDC